MNITIILILKNVQQFLGCNVLCSVAVFIPIKYLVFNIPLASKFK